MGLIFDSQKQLEDVMEELMNRMFKEENVEKLKEKNVVIMFQIKDPDYQVMLDPQHPEVIRKGVSGKADIIMKMEADFMHEFWLGRTDMIESIKNKDLTIEIGPEVAAAKLIDLLPLMVPGLDYYEEICEKFGLVV
ncbi:MAG: hypothetical protein GX364_08580 [Firmicutes bacterium]|jgi:alkyl sulfatase BDS1-like metallo-beta-lactamase superfamily hydrolase|nr:hypothetical protein [Bacillota bacterium]